MPKKDATPHAAQIVRNWLSDPDFRRALKSGHPPLPDDERFKELLDRLDRAEKNEGQ